MKRLQLLEVLGTKEVSMTQLAEMLGTTYDHIADITTGTIEATKEELEAIAKALNVEVEELFE